MTGSNMYLWRLSTREPGNSQLESSRIWNYPVIQLVQRMKPFHCNLGVILLSLAGLYPGQLLFIIINKLYCHETPHSTALPWFQSLHLSQIILSFLPSSLISDFILLVSKILFFLHLFFITQTNPKRFSTSLFFLSTKGGGGVY